MDEAPIPPNPRCMNPRFCGEHGFCTNPEWCGTELALRARASQRRPPHMDDVSEIAARLIPFEVERLTGWKGPAGAAYNEISEGLCKMGLLNRDWSLSPLGLRVRVRLEETRDD